MNRRKSPSKKPRNAPQQAVVQARYDAAGHGRRLRGWVAPSTGPNRATEQQPTLRNRARDAGRNEWAGASGTRIWTTNLIGTGIVPRPLTKDPALKRKLTELWNAWTALSDADGVLDFYGQQTLAVRSWIESGEVFVRSRISALNNELHGTQSQIKATGTTLGLTAAQAKTNLSEFQAQFEAMLRSMGKSDTEVTAIKRLIADVESGRRAIQSLSTAEQAMWKTYTEGANAARAQDALGLKSISAYKAEIEKLKSPSA